jgi:hypothetical protein
VRADGKKADATMGHWRLILTYAFGTGRRTDAAPQGQRAPARINPREDGLSPYAIGV